MVCCLSWLLNLWPVAQSSYLFRYLRRTLGSSSASQGAGSATSSIDIGDGTISRSAIERLEAAEKVAEQFVKQRIKPALRRAQEVR